MKATSLVFAAALLVAPSAAVATERVGIAFVQAPEQGSGVCTGIDPVQAFACATEKCMQSGADARDCLRTTWCFPAGWSADVLLLHNEGVHWHEITCGWPTRKAALDAAKITCERAHRDFIVDCTIAQIYNPDGKPELKN